MVVLYDLISVNESRLALADARQAQEAQSGQPAGKAAPAHPPRATDAFYAKLLPALEV